jgi:hypothetical protein
VRRGAAVALAVAMIFAVWDVSAQRAAARAGTACGPNAIVPVLSRYPYQWKAGMNVRVWFDRDGRAARGTHRNPAPKFTLDDMDERALFDGINQWGWMPETGVVFTHVPSNPRIDANYWVTVAWPTADIAYKVSDGTMRRVPCRVPPASLFAAAYSCSFEDQINAVSQSHTIVATITMLNTHHSYISPADGSTHHTWERAAPGWLTALTKVGAHENGHAMGLSDLPALFPEGSPTPHIMKPFNGTNDNAPLGGMPRLGRVTNCDRETILGHSSGQYRRWVCAGPGAVAPPQCEAGLLPACEEPESVFPAPIWSCEIPPSKGRGGFWDAPPSRSP